MRTNVAFNSDRFNTTEVKPHFINPRCFGEDLAAFLAERLTAKGSEVSEPYQEDWGWELGAAFDEERCRIGVGRQEDHWLVFVEPHKPNWVRQTFYKERTADPTKLCLVLHQCLKEAEGIHDIQWFRNGPRGQEVDYASTPDGA